MISDKNAPLALIATSFFVNALFILPIVVPAYLEKGASIGDFMMIQGLASIFVCLLELPSGYFGDIFSRKKNVMVGHLFYIAGYAILYLFDGLAAIMAQEACIAVALSLFSGTSEAYLYDLLKRTGRENAFHRYYSLQRTVLNVGCLIAAVAGTFLYARSGLNAVLLTSIGCVALSLILLCFIPDVAESVRVVNGDKIRDILNITARTFKDAFLRRVIFMAAVFGVGTGLAYWGLQPILILKHAPTALFGVFLTMNQVFRSCWSAAAAKILDALGEVRTCVLTGGVIILTIGFCTASVLSGSLAATYAALTLMTLGAASFDLTAVVANALINGKIRSDERATVISVNSMTNRLVGGLFFIALKPLYENFGTRTTTCLFAFFIIPVIFTVWRIVKGTQNRQA